MLCFFSHCSYAFFYTSYSNFSIFVPSRTFAFYLLKAIILFYFFLLFLLLLISRNLLLILIILELLGFLLVLFLVTSFSAFVSRDYLVLILFSVLVIEGVIALCGLIRLVRYRGRDYLVCRSFLKFL